MGAISVADTDRQIFMNAGLNIALLQTSQELSVLELSLGVRKQWQAK
jgi:hypothetical protein